MSSGSSWISECTLVRYLSMQEEAGSTKANCELSTLSDRLCVDQVVLLQVPIYDFRYNMKSSTSNQLRLPACVWTVDGRFAASPNLRLQWKADKTVDSCRRVCGGDSVREVPDSLRSYGTLMTALKSYSCKVRNPLEVTLGIQQKFPFLVRHPETISCDTVV